MTQVSDERSLLLLRHAKAEQVPGKADHDRQLTPRGRRDAERVGAWLREQGIVPELVICSTSVRTRQTWEHAVRGGAQAEFLEYRKAVYEGSAEQILETIREDAGDVRTLLVIGHAPSIPRLATQLADGEGSDEAHQALAEGFPTAALALLRVSGAWDGLEPGQAALERFHVCRGARHTSP